MRCGGAVHLLSFRGVRTRFDSRPRWLSTRAVARRLPRHRAEPVESPSMAFAIVLLLVGAVVLTVGAESAVRGAARIAGERGVSPFVIGALLFGVDVESL